MGFRLSTAGYLTVTILPQLAFFVTLIACMALFYSQDLAVDYSGFGRAVFAPYKRHTAYVTLLYSILLALTTLFSAIATWYWIAKKSEHGDDCAGLYLTLASISAFVTVVVDIVAVAMLFTAGFKYPATVLQGFVFGPLYLVGGAVGLTILALVIYPFAKCGYDNYVAHVARVARVARKNSDSQLPV